jgi:hypothetical protein
MVSMMAMVARPLWYYRTMLTSVYTPGLGSGEATHAQGARSAMGQVRQRLSSTAGAPSCGARLDQMFWAFYWLGQAQAHVDSMAGEMAYATSALLNVLRHDVDKTWKAVRSDCRL